MGYLELFAQRTFAEETERITGGAAGWQDPPEIRLEKVQSDGLLVIRQPSLLERLAAPWSEARFHDEVMLELKLVGNHLDRRAIERALLRRQARQLQRVLEQTLWLGEEPLWLVAPNLPDWLTEMRRPACFAPGCYWIEPQWQRFLWIAANELPLVDELVPFLMARSGRALDEFARWAAPRRPPEWTLTMVEHRPMSQPIREDLLRDLGKAKLDDPEVEARRVRILQFLFEESPAGRKIIEQSRAEVRAEVQAEVRAEVQAEVRLIEARDSLREVLALRNLTPSQDQDARIEACTDLATLKRWHRQAVTATSVTEALE